MSRETPDAALVARWRLILGREAKELSLGADGRIARIEQLVGFLDTGRAGEAGAGSDGLSVPEWVEGVTELFPRQVREVMEREFIRRRGIGELLEQPEVLERIEPNVDLVKTILTHKDLLTENTRALARRIIEKVVEDLKRSMQLQVESALTGAIRRDRHSPRRSYRNLDLTTTVRRNLRHFDRRTERLIVDRIYYFAAERNRRPWHIVIAVDQSGSMLESAIYSAVMASIFHELPSVRTSLFLFDTRVVDLSDQVGQPVDVLLQVQLGGGTSIAGALRYASQLVREPGRTIVVLITDFFEGGPEDDLVRQTEDLTQSGVRMIGLGALGSDARPAYNQSTARKLKKVGMDVLVCTPERLAECMAQIIRG